MTDELVLAVDEARFIENVREALSNGYDRCCTQCGVGVYDDTDMHDRRCPEYVPFRPSEPETGK